MRKQNNVFNYIHVLFIGICILTVLAFSIQYSLKRERIQKNMNKSVDLMVKGVQENLLSMDKLYIALEMYVDTRLKQAIDQMNDVYEKGDLNQAEIERIQADYDHVNLYVINSDNIIIMSTLEKDLNLDFNQYSLYSEFFNGLRDSKEYISDRTSIGLETDQLTKYSYQSTADGHFILDASYDIQSFDYLLEGNSFLDYSSEIMMATNYVIELELYEAYNDIEERLLTIYSMDKLDEMRAVEEAKSTGKITRYTEYDGVHTIKTIYIPFVIEHKNGTDTIFIYKLTYTDKLVLKNYNETYITTGLLFFIGTLIFISLSQYYNIKTLRPISKLLISFESVRGKNFDVQLEPEGSKPVKDAIVTFNEMVESIRTLLGDKEKIENDLRQHLRQSEQGYVNTVTAMANAIDAKDNYTGGHCERVMKMSLLVAEYMSLSDHQVKDLKYASLLHDIGKIGINDAILNKEDAFTDEDYEMMKQHPEIGYRILLDVEFLEEANKAILYHHERIDGLGYPHGLKGDDIPYLGRLLCITDAFDAMTSKRIYKSTVMTVREAFVELEKYSYKQFDSKLVYQFKRAYENSYGIDLNHYADEIE